MKKYLFLLSFATFICFSFFPSSFAMSIACTEEAKMCSDGSFVSRTGPNCEFSACPSEIQIPKACTKEYKPVCGKVEVQCIMAPCYPIAESYGNRCMLEAAGSEYLHDGVCEQEGSLIPGKSPDDAHMCPMIYAPVCGQDNTTYGNSCMAQYIGVKYEGACLSKIQEYRISQAWNTAFDTVVSEKTVSEVHKILDRAETRLESYKSENSLNSNIMSLFGFVQYLIEQTRGRFWVQ